MPTVIGCVFFALGVFFFFYKQEGLLGLLILASAFEASSAINILDRGIQPYYLIAGVIIIRALLNRALGSTPHRSMPYGWWLLSFAGIAVLSAFFLPIMFEGLPVYDPKIGIDDGLIIHPPLRFGLNNAAQAGFLTCHVATAYAILSLKTSGTYVRRAYMAAFYVVVGFICAESVCQLVGVAFPYSVILNNPGYGLWDNESVTNGTRNPGTFSEPSLVGGFLVFYGICFIAQYLTGKGKAFRVLVALVANGAVASSGSLFILFAALLALIVAYSPLRFPWHLNLGQAKRTMWIVLILIVPAVALLVFAAGYRDTLFALTVEKGASGSFFNRTASDLYALQLLAVTHGLGVGLGSNRSSSMVCSLGSNIGVLGLFAFGMFYIRLLLGLGKNRQWFKWGAFALLSNMALDIADVTFPILWVPVFIAIHFTLRDSETQRAQPVDEGRLHVHPQTRMRPRRLLATTE